MDFRFLTRIVGHLILFLGVIMLIPVAVSLIYRDGDTAGLLAAAGVTLAAGVVLSFALGRKRKEISHREGFAIVTFSWVAAGVMGALPFFFTGTFDGFTDCLFESVSGFTTTGASVMTDIESVPHGVLFWRSLTHWLGGMGIILLSIAILPLLGVGGMQLYKAEVPGPISEKVRPRVAETAKTLWYVYLILSGIEFILLLFGGMDVFDSLCHTFGTMATGGFSTKNASIAHYDSVYVEAVITVFMFLAGINFALHYLALTGRPRAYLRNPELRVYAGITFGAIAVFTVGLWAHGHYADLATSFRYAMFQIPTILTTTGYATADFEIWPAWMHVILVAFMFIGGCAGSTGGGMKVMRIQILLSSAYNELYHLIHPHAVTTVRFGDRTIPADVVRGVWNFFFIFIGLFVFASVAMALTGTDLVTAVASVVACIGNIGPGLGLVGPTDNYAHIHVFGKYVLVGCMLLGRLEVYTVLVLLVPAFWRR